MRIALTAVLPVLLLAAAMAGPTLLLSAAAPAADAPVPAAVDERPGEPGEWGFRPAEGEPCPVNPPGFSWRPQKGAKTYDLEVARDAAFAAPAYRAAGLAYNVHCPPRTFEAGTWHWRFRFTDAAGRTSAWSRPRAFTPAADAVAFPMPPRDELLSRIPKAHPRLFIRPEDLPRLRQLARGPLKPQYDALVKECDRLLKDPPPTAEPPTYPKDMDQKSEPWREMWWGNRVYTIKVLNSAATLGFTRLLGGCQEYGQLARRLLMDAARWDPVGATGYRYNDEAGMPYAYYFSRTYSFVNDLLTDEEKALCRQVMTVRGREMFRHLSPGHLWRPYGSHSNRAWHFLGEVGIAFKDEIPEADDWTWFAMNVFFNAYPVWSDADGGWHEGVSYWSSYVQRFTWWADVMRAAMGVDAYRKPYFSQCGYYAMYLQPPGTVGGGFGDLCESRTSAHNRGLMTTLAGQAGNPYWQWYVDAVGGPAPEGGYVGFVRGSMPAVEAKAPSDLPSSRCFRGTGQAYLNTNLLRAEDNVSVLFKSSPFGTQSHGYESSNSLILYAFGERLLIRTGRRDIYGSEHHVKWMWSTRSTNCVTVGGQGQKGHSAAAQGRILGFHTSPAFDYVAGEAGGAYDPKVLERFTRHVLFVKPGLVVVFDRLKAPSPAPMEWWLHAPTPMTVAGAEDIRVAAGKAGCRVSVLHPPGLTATQTDKFDPPPRPRIKVTEYHLTLAAPPAAETEFIATLRPHRSGETPPAEQTLRKIDNGYAVEAALPDGRVLVLLRARDAGTMALGDQQADADVAAVRFDAAGKAAGHIVVRGETVTAGPGPLPR
jgi:hypothetical protein